MPRWGTGESTHDCLSDDASAAAWLQAAGQLESGFDGSITGHGEAARALREAGARLVDPEKQSEVGDLDVINRILEAGSPIRCLDRNLDGQIVLTERRRNESLACLLEAIAAAFSHLLVHEELAQIRQCEAHDCTLRFLDATKSRRRRWCSMAVCGNRMKVAAFRARKDPS